MSQRGYRKRESAELDLLPERPSLVGEIIEFYRTELNYSIDDLAKARVHAGGVDVPLRSSTLKAK